MALQRPRPRKAARRPVTREVALTDLAEKAVVVTGAGREIGRALARQCAERGARIVVLADLDEHGLEHKRALVGDGARAWQGDVADPTAILELIAGTEAERGQIDLFCANAGIAGDGGIGPCEEIWSRMLEVNVTAHVRATRALLPGWLERGRGRLLVTASAAGLLTQLGSAPTP